MEPPFAPYYSKLQLEPKLFRFLLQLFSALRTRLPSIYKMTINKEMGSVILKFVPNSGNENLGLNIAPLQNSRTVSKTDGLNGFQHLRLQPSPLLFQSFIFWPGSNWDLTYASAFRASSTVSENRTLIISSTTSSNPTSIIFSLNSFATFSRFPNIRLA
jgi:hypothetical protein